MQKYLIDKGPVMLYALTVLVGILDDNPSVSTAVGHVRSDSQIGSLNASSFVLDAGKKTKKTRNSVIYYSMRVKRCERWSDCVNRMGGLKGP